MSRAHWGPAWGPSLCPRFDYVLVCEKSVSPCSCVLILCVHPHTHVCVCTALGCGALQTDPHIHIEPWVHPGWGCLTRHLTVISWGIAPGPSGGSAMMLVNGHVVTGQSRTDGIGLQSRIAPFPKPAPNQAPITYPPFGD